MPRGKEVRGKLTGMMGNPAEAKRPGLAKGGHPVARELSWRELKTTALLGALGALERDGSTFDLCVLFVLGTV